MAILHGNADITPTKPELLATWLPTQPWFVGDASALEHLGAYRFDDPDGEVGMLPVVRMRVARTRRPSSRTRSARTDDGSGTLRTG